MPRGNAWDARSAASTAAYLALVTPAGPGGAGYDLARLLIRSRALDELPGLHARVEVYHGTAPLVHATAPGLAPETLDALRRRADVPWAGAGAARGGRVALAPLFDRQGWDVVGAVAARADVPDALLAAWLAVAVVFTLVAGVLAVRSLGGRPDALRPAFRRYAAAAGLLGFVAGADVRAIARDATDLWLADARVLMQDAAARLPELRSAPASLAPIARDAEVVVGDSAGAGARRRDVAGLPRASVAVRLAPGRWAEVRTAPDEARAWGWFAAAFGLALLGPLGVAAAAWAARAATRPRYLRETTAAWGFLAPSALHLAVFSLVPILFACYLSVHRWSLIEPVRPFVGLDNYARLLRDPLVWAALRNTVLYVLYVPVSAALALAVALALRGRSRGVRALRTAFFLPSVASAVAVALVWQWIYRPEGGLLNSLLARVHGAGAWQRFWRITFPLLRPVTLGVLATGIVGAFQVFTYVYVLTGGGPPHATDVAVYRIYQTGWEFAQFGSASALALLVLVLLGGVGWMQFRLLARRAGGAGGPGGAGGGGGEVAAGGGGGWGGGGGGGVGGGRVRRLLLLAIMSLVAGIMVAPFLYMVATAASDATSFAPAFGALPFARFVLNSGLMAAGVVAGRVLTSAMAGYAFARLRFPGRERVFLGYLAALAVPGIGLLVPRFLIIGALGWVDSYQGLISTELVSVGGIFLLRQFFRTLPRDLEDAARLEGAGEWTIFWRIMLPLARPALAALAVLGFVDQWKSLLWPLIVTRSTEMRVLEVGLATFHGLYAGNGPYQMAAAAVAVAPPVVLYFVAQKYFIRGIQLTGV